MNSPISGFISLTSAVFSLPVVYVLVDAAFSEKAAFIAPNEPGCIYY